MNIESSPEFSRIIRADQLPDHDAEFNFEAEPAERDKLAIRFSLQSLNRLQARVWARRIGGSPVVRVRVNFVADVLQSCVVTLDPVAAHIDEWFELEFAPADGIGATEEVIFEADDDDPPEEMVGGQFDIGEAISEHLALSLDDYPRKPGVEFSDQIEHADERASADSPFAVLRNNQK
tara:strand:+ start:4542 stop:5075 length:534 start_codon:yes stop_codon:yes gene_type:complete